MKTVIVKQGQTIWDIAIQHCGDMEAAFQIIEMNDISITETLSAGMELTVPAVINRRVVDYYKNNSISPATGEMEHLQELPEGLLVTNNEASPLLTNNNEFYIVRNNE